MKSPLFTVLLFGFSLISHAQTFTKVDDPSNPVVTDLFESGGGSWADIDNDGDLDLFVANGNLANQNNSFYLNDGTGGFIRVSTGAVVTDGGSSIGGAWGDYDHDGFIDLFVTNRSNFGNFLYKGTGDTLFTKVTTGLPVTDIGNSNSTSWLDIEGDGDLDMFVINFMENNYLYLNDGSPSFTFTRVDTGALVNDGSLFSISGSWGDKDANGLPDLFMGNAGSQDDDLYRNLGNGAFSITDLTDGRSTLGSSWGDYDNDGDPDLFVANFLSQGNILYNNSGEPDYVLVRVDTGVVSTDAANSVGSAWGDVDNDGDLDLFVSNDGGANFLYLNSGVPDYSFSKVITGPVVTESGNSFGSSFADYDSDGDLDLFVANRLNQANFLYRNDEPPQVKSWMIVRCEGISSTRSAIGTRVRVKAVINGNPVWQMREVPGQTGYNSQNTELHFGFGNATIADSVVITWQSGIEEILSGVGLNTVYAAVEGQGLIVGVDETDASVPARYELSQNYPNPFNPTTTISYQLPAAGHVTLSIYSILGQEIATLVDGMQEAGYREAAWDASGVASGAYLYRIEARSFGKNQSFTDWKKMLLVK